jgi:hypothetical protein
LQSNFWSHSNQPIFPEQSFLFLNHIAVRAMMRRIVPGNVDIGIACFQTDNESRNLASQGFDFNSDVELLA